MSFLIDTCVISELRKISPANSVMEWFSSVDEDELFVSALTIGEIEYGISVLNNGRKKSSLMEWFEKLKFQFKDNSLVITPEIASRWGEMRTHLKNSGITISVVDGLIAASAIDKDFLLVTRNIADFKNTGAKTKNEINFNNRKKSGRATSRVTPFRNKTRIGAD